MNEQLYIIWSYDHRAWWRPDSAGYTCFREAAGRYTRRVAASIQANKSPRCGSRREACKTSDVMVPA